MNLRYLVLLAFCACPTTSNINAPIDVLNFSAAETTVAAMGSTTLTVSVGSSTAQTIAGTTTVSLQATAGYFNDDVSATSYDLSLMGGDAQTVSFHCSGDGSVQLTASGSGLPLRRVRITCGAGEVTGPSGPTNPSGPSGVTDDDDNMMMPPPTPSDDSKSAISVTTAVPVVLVSTATAINAVLKGVDGTAAPNTEVLFSTNLGTFAGGAAVAVVDSSGGNASAMFTAPANKGVATITASFTDSEGVPRVATTVVRVVGAGDVSIVLSATEGELASPGATSAITATVYDGATPDTTATVDVVLSGPTGIGSLILQSSAAGATTAPDGRQITNAATGSGGIVRVDLSAGVASGSATISFTSGGVTELITIAVEGPGSLGAAVFQSAVPAVIRVKGSINPNISVVTFQFVDASGAPVAEGLPVTFALPDSASNDVFVSPATATTNNMGVASTILSAGGQAETVTVTATASSFGVTVAATSTGIAIVGGIPEYSHMSWSCAVDDITTNGFFLDGASTECTLRLADRFSNSVDIGTQVSFRTEAGRVNATGVVVTASGTVKATLDAADPRPTLFATTPNVGVTQVFGVPSYSQHIPAQPLPSGTENIPGVTAQQYTRSLIQKIGKVRIIGVTMGEESFIDGNGNKVYDQGELFIDLPEPFLDKNGNGVQDSCLVAGVPFETVDTDLFYACYEDFIDLNGDGQWNTGNLQWDNYTAIWKHIDVTWVDHAWPELYPLDYDDAAEELFTASGVNQPLGGATTWHDENVDAVQIGGGGLVASGAYFVLRVNDQNYNCDTKGQRWHFLTDDKPRVTGITNVGVQIGDAGCEQYVVLTEETTGGPRTGGGTAVGTLIVPIINDNDNVKQTVVWPLELPLAP